MEIPSSATQTEIKIGAGFWIRVLARLIDTGLGYLLGLIAGVIIGFIFGFLQVFGSVSPGWQKSMQGFSFFGIGLNIFGGILYHTVTEGTYGASIGKLVCKLHVLGKDGLPCKMKSALIRSLAYYWDGLFFGIVGYNKMVESSLRQRYGDVWGNTVIVKTVTIPNNVRKSFLRFSLSISIGSMCWISMIALGLVIKYFKGV